MPRKRLGLTAQKINPLEEVDDDQIIASVDTPVQLGFDYDLIPDAKERQPVRNRVAEIKLLYKRSFNNAIAMGEHFIFLKETLEKHGLWLQILREEFGCERPHDIRTVQDLMMIARNIKQQPNAELQYLAEGEIKPYLLARLLAPSTPDEAREEVRQAVQEAKAENKPVSPKTVQKAINKHKQPARSGGSSGTARSGGSSPAPSSPPTPAPTPETKPPEIRSFIPQQSAAREMESETLTINTQAQQVPGVDIRPGSFYQLGKHMAFAGSPSDPRWQAGLPQTTDRDGQALFQVAMSHAYDDVLHVVVVDGTYYIACQDSDLLGDLIDDWTEKTGKKPIRLDPVR